MELDAQLTDGNTFAEKAIHNIVLEAFNIHLQKIDGGIAVSAHYGWQIPAFEGHLINALLSDGVRTFSGIFGQREFDDPRRRGKANREETQIMLIALFHCGNSGWRRVKYENWPARNSGQLQFKTHTLSDACAITYLREGLVCMTQPELLSPTSWTAGEDEQKNPSTVRRALARSQVWNPMGPS
jgi:hypothetical protein